MDPSSSSSSNKRKRDLDCWYKRPKYDVFVNYESEDIGKRFVSHLKGALGREAFTICDHTMLPLGQDERSELLKAIEESEIYLLLFSDKYASSVRCLEEFALIMESYPKYKHRKVLPVFFNVEPTDVKNQHGPFLDAFKDHETKVDPNKVQNWRQALREAGHLSGLTFQFQNGDEAEFVHKILKHVRNMQNPQQLCNVNHLVGIESRAQDIISALRLGEQTFTIVAVLGLSGTGKTASVKAVYDMIAPEFDAECFIQNIRSNYTNREADLQKDVISYLTGNDMFIVRHNDGAARIRKLMSSRKALLVLDDVYDSDQLEAVIIDSASFHCRSRIIVTTINKQSLSCLHRYTPYNIRLLDDSESFQLFTGLAFGEQDTVEKNFVHEIVRHAGGIPLVLKVWGRYFRDYERKLWPSLLEKLKRIPHEDTQNKLQIIYGLLPKRAQNLFLDIACFFDGMHKDTVVKVLQDEYFFPDVEIQNFVHKFLVKNESPWTVSLHDVIKKMGQEVVRQEDEFEPGKRTRVMGYTDVVRVLGDCSGTDSVRSIKLDWRSDWMKGGANVQLEAFKKMSNLRFIEFTYLDLQWWSSSNDMSACFSFKHLKYLEWWYFPCKSLDNFDMGNVVVIKLWDSYLEKLWEGVKSCKKLKHLDVSFSRSLNKTGNFNGLENLEELDLKECEILEGLDSSIGCLHQLTSLTLSKCTNLKSIPDLPLNIEYFEANDCINLVNLPSNCSELQFLKKLELKNCSKLGSECFTQVTRLRNLQKLDMKNCNVSQVSSRIGNFVLLRFLNLSRNTFSSLPDSFSNLSKLEYLKINDCSQLQLLPPLPSQLGRIEATNCGSLNVMPFDSMQKAYIFPSKVFKELLTGSEGFNIGLYEEEVPEWCTYRNSGNVLSFVAPLHFHHNKICGLIFYATTNYWTFSTLHNKTKEKSHRIVMRQVCDNMETMDDVESEDDEGFCLLMGVVFYPLNDKTLVVEAGDTVELQFDDDDDFMSCGLRLIYEEDVVDSGLVLKDVREPLFPTSEMSAGIIQLSGDDDDVHVNDDGLIIQDVTNPTLPVFPSPESEIMSGIITQLNDIEVCSSIQDVEYPCYDYFNAVPEFQMYWEGKL